MPVRISKYEFLFNGMVTRTFDSKEMAYMYAFNKGYKTVEYITVLTTQ